jgi:uncharacterized membrane protein
MTAVVIFLALLGSSIWFGGFVAIAVVARIARRQLDRPAQVAFFRALGRRYIVVAAPALVVALAAGGVLLADRPWDGTALAAVLTASALVLVTGAGVAQARAMTRLRQRVLREGDDEALATRLHRGALLANVLRAAIGLLSLALLALAAVLAG